MHYGCHLCKDTGRVFHWSRIFNVPCWKCKERREQEEKIFAEKIAAIHPPISLPKPRLKKISGGAWTCASGFKVFYSMTPRGAYAAWKRGMTEYIRNKYK